MPTVRRQGPSWQDPGRDGISGGVSRENRIGPEAAGIQHDDLDPLAGRSLGAGKIDPGAAASFIICGNLPVIEKQVLGMFPVRKRRAGVVRSVIMIVPRRQNVGLGTKRCHRRDRTGLFICSFELRHVGGCHVAIHVVAEKQKSLRPIAKYCVPNRLWPFLIGAGPEGNACQRGLSRRQG